jgi:hypothetical protein
MLMEKEQSVLDGGDLRCASPRSTVGLYQQYQPAASVTKRNPLLTYR